LDPVSLIVTALAAGAAAGLKPMATEVIQDAYAGLKRLIQHKYADVDLGPLEQKPESNAKRESLREDLDVAGAGADEELLAQAQKVAALVQQHDPVVAAAIGVDLDDFEAANLRIRKVESEGTGVRVHKGRLTGDIEIGEVRAGRGDRGPANPP
jgi:hypothetical protein